MKKSIVLLTAVFLVSLTTYAQGDIRFGAKTGVNFSKFGGDSAADGRTSFHIGAIAEFPISDTFSVQPELMYSGEGSENADANFMRVVGVAKYYIIEGLSLEGGPQFGFRISQDQIVDQLTKGFDFGLALGGGYEIQDLGLLFGMRYNVGIANLSKQDNVDFSLSTFQISVGYFFN
ncbi:MAG: porin family protein [Bacteroidota bacterium]